MEHFLTANRFPLCLKMLGDVFYITDHYRNSRYVLMRLSKASPGQVEAFLRRRWHDVAPKKLHAAFGAKPEVTVRPAAARKTAEKKREAVTKKATKKRTATRKASPARSKTRGQRRQPRG